MRSGIISFLSDFGSQDPYVGVVKGVMLGINPQANIVDIVHHIMPQDIVRAAFLLATCVDWFPRTTVHLAVVDPGVGSSRRAIAIQGERHFYVGPDNGVFSLALKRDKPVGMVELRPGSWTEGRISKTFHGRDVFAPAAAYLSKGVSLESLGTTIDSIRELDFPSNKFNSSVVHTSIVHQDVYGNLVTMLHAGELQRPVLSVTASGHEIPVHDTFADVKNGDYLAYWGSSDYLEIAVNQGSASRSLNLKIGDDVQVNLGR